MFAIIYVLGNTGHHFMNVVCSYLLHRIHHFSKQLGGNQSRHQRPLNLIQLLRMS